MIKSEYNVMDTADIDKAHKYGKAEVERAQKNGMKKCNLCKGEGIVKSNENLDIFCMCILKRIVTDQEYNVFKNHLMKVFRREAYKIDRKTHLKHVVNDLVYVYVESGIKEFRELSEELEFELEFENIYNDFSCFDRTKRVDLDKSYSQMKHGSVYRTMFYYLIKEFLEDGIVKEVVPGKYQLIKVCN